LNKFAIKQRIDNTIFFLYNLFSHFIFIFYKNKVLIKKNVNFKDIHEGERCFILGTGPSLNNIDPDDLKNEITFGVNFLYRSELMRDITPTYYTFLDDGFYEEHKESMKSIIEGLPKTKFFVRTKATSAIKALNINDQNIYYQYCNLYQYGDYIKLDMTKNMTAPFNVVLSCIQTAIYMGFNEIYLIGSDFNTFATLKEEHCYDKDGLPSDRSISLGLDLWFYSIVSYQHYALAKYAKENNIRIYNLSPNSLLDAYEKKDIKDIINI
jgi:hypothetical protein